MYNIEKLKISSDIEKVIEHLGIPHKKSGATMFMECPSPDHAEHKFDNCAVSKDKTFCYCYSCRRSFDSISAVKNYLQKKDGNKLSFYEVLGITADALGGKELFVLDQTKAKKRKDVKENQHKAFYNMLYKNCPKGTDLQIVLKEFWRRQAEL